MHNTSLLFFIVCLLHTGYYANAQRLGSKGNNLTAEEPVYSHQYRYLTEPTYYFIDTSFSTLGWYHQWNNAHQDLMDYSVLGNMGGPLNKLTYRPNTNLWDYYDLKAYDTYFNSRETVPFYYTRSPLTEATYWQGYERGQNFKIYHTQNINKYWNFLVQYKRLNSLGFYDHNRNKQANFMMSSMYDNPEWGYKVTGYFLSEKLETEEWGGLVNDSLFEQNLESNRILLDVNLPSDKRFMRNREFYIDQRLKLARLFPHDTDSTGSVKEDRAYLAIGHEFNYGRKSDVYIGNATDGFYSNYFFNNDTYKDSSSSVSYSNAFYVEAEVGSKSKFGVKGGIRHLITEYAGPNYRFSGQNWGITGEVTGKISDLVDVKGNLDYILTGDLKESVRFGGQGRINLWKEINARARYELVLKYPGFYEQFYYSNNFIWNNSFRKQGNILLAYGLYWGKGNKLEASNQTITDYVYYGVDGQPVQNDDVIRISKFELIQNFTLWDFLHQDNQVYYQTTTDVNKVLPLPNWVARNSLYFQFPLFKKALKCLVGGEVKYFSAYSSSSFNAATGEFFVENKKRIGDYPLIDLFACFKIKKAKVFLKYEHFNQGLLDYTYFAAPDYPFPDRILRLGISWRFFN
ncbi:MAG: hypothetical protein CMI35_16970 [Owenweeksia sp.]|nr:hypothetical protein [Owenweeksia sp.]|tara:strand:- start:455 stop:2341 length:1887 start_codon:yes stop_codon:yes gene_type:complete